MNSFKTFNDFGEGIVEMSNFIPEIKEIVDGVVKDIYAITPKELTAALAEIVMNDFPYVDFRSPALSISYKEVGFKSRSVLSFGWKYINNGDGKMRYSFRVSFFSRSEPIKEIEAKLLEAGWEQPAERENFFPYKNNFKKKEKKAKEASVVKKPEVAPVKKEEPVQETINPNEVPESVNEKF